MARFSARGSEDEDDRPVNRSPLLERSQIYTITMDESEEEIEERSDNKRSLFEKSPISDMGGYEDNNGEGSRGCEYHYKRTRFCRSLFTNKPRFFTPAPTAAARATTSSAPQPQSYGEIPRNQQEERVLKEMEEDDEESVEESEEEAEEETDYSEHGQGEQPFMEFHGRNQHTGTDLYSAISQPPRNSIPNGNGSDDRPTRPIADGDVIVTLSDPDVLDCPICLEPLSLPVFQCENGHIACALCCTRMGNKCGNCSLPIGYNRCRAMEKVLESAKVLCKNVDYGCNETICYGKRLDHENTCNYAPCSCPHLDCEFVGPSKFLYMHFQRRHPDSSKWFFFKSVIHVHLQRNQNQIFLQERNEGIIFILNRSKDTFGSLLNVVCIGPTSARRFSYNLISRDGESLVKLKSFAESMPKWVADPTVNQFLLVPNCFIYSSGVVKLEVIIREAT